MRGSRGARLFPSGRRRRRHSCPERSADRPDRRPRVSTRQNRPCAIVSNQLDRTVSGSTSSRALQPSASDGGKKRPRQGSGGAEDGGGNASIMEEKGP